MKVQPLIVFDMDGVIIDVSRSYRDTVRRAAKLFFKGAGSWENLPEPLFPLSDLARVKQSGGLNNDWDLTCLVIDLLYSLVNGPAELEPKDQDTWSRFKKTINLCNVTELGRFLRSTDGPLFKLFKKGAKQKSKFVMDFYEGDVGSGNIIKQIFQEIYLGPDLFIFTYGLLPEIYHGQGLINQEKLLIDKSALKNYSKYHILALATGRPKAEADYPLDLFGLRKYFTVVYTLDDCLREEQRILRQEGKMVSLSKPNPFMLDAIAEKIKHQVNRFYYIGDMPDDMTAASRSEAGFTAIGFLAAAPDKDSLKSELLRSGADYIIEDWEELNTVILNKL
jgi:phosphoglycolate phosphatase-like HAD superfamily hydrolase